MQRRKNLIFWRIEQRLRQKDVAEKLGVSSGHYSSIESGIANPSYEMLVKFQEVYNVKDILSLFEKEGQHGHRNSTRAFY